MPRLTGALAGAILAATACAAHAGPVQPGHEEGLGLLPHSIPDELKKAEANPYAPPPEPVCASINQELGVLEKVLGPDVDAVQPKGDKAKSMITDAVRSAIPYHGWIRKITGAEHADHVRDKDMLAAWERRGYLKGLSREKRCVLPKPETTLASAPDEAPGAADAQDLGVAASATTSTEGAVSAPEPLPPVSPAYPSLDQPPAYAPQAEPGYGPAPDAEPGPAYAPAQGYPPQTYYTPDPEGPPGGGR